MIVYVHTIQTHVHFIMMLTVMEMVFLIMEDQQKDLHVDVIHMVVIIFVKTHQKMLIIIKVLYHVLL